MKIALSIAIITLLIFVTSCSSVERPMDVTWSQSQETEYQNKFETLRAIPLSELKKDQLQWLQNYCYVKSQEYRLSGAAVVYMNLVQIYQLQEIKNFTVVK